MSARRSLSEQSPVRRALRPLLIIIVLFALWHVSQHDVQSAVDGNGHCEICRLNHVPVTGSAAQALFTAIFICTALLITAGIPQFRSKSYLPRLARGPPFS